MDQDALAVRLAGEIAQLIAVGEVTPDEHLSTQKLADKFEVSRTPVREALELVREQGLVEKRTNRGYFARRIGKRAQQSAVQTLMSASEAPPAYYRLAEDWVKEAVRSEITERDIRERYELSKFQAAAVLNRGVEEGWIENKPGYGWRLLDVAKTPDALEQIYRFRLIVEPAGLMEPTFHIDHLTVERLRTLLKAMAGGAIDTWPHHRLWMVGVEFHEEIMRMSGNRVLYQSLCRANRLRRLLEYRTMLNRARVYDETHEHIELLDVILKGDPVDAAYHMRQHLQGAISRKRGTHA